MNKQSKKQTISLILAVVGMFLVFTCQIPASPLQLLADVGLIMCIVGAAMSISEAVKRKKSQKKDDEETTKW